MAGDSEAEQKVYEPKKGSPDEQTMRSKRLQQLKKSYGHKVFTELRRTAMLMGKAEGCVWLVFHKRVYMDIAELDFLGVFDRIQCANGRVLDFFERSYGCFMGENGWGDDTETLAHLRGYPDSAGSGTWWIDTETGCLDVRGRGLDDSNVFRVWAKKEESRSVGLGLEMDVWDTRL